MEDTITSITWMKGIKDKMPKDKREMTLGDTKETPLVDPGSEVTLTRRQILKRSAVLALTVPAMSALLAACGGDEDDDEGAGDGASGAPTATAAAPDTSTETPTAETDGSDDPPGEGQYGGRLEVALSGDLLTMDMHAVSATALNLVGFNIYETLFTWDAEYANIPMLAESHEVSDDGLTHTIHLREGVIFHNGEEMTSADVIASIERWGTDFAYARSLLDATDELVATDDYTIEFQLNRQFGTLSVALATQGRGCAIYPKSVIDASTMDSLAEYIGTGPYKFVQWDRDRQLLLERYEEYAALEGDANGYGGHKYAYVDEIRFVPVPDEGARQAGLSTGEYHFLETVPSDLFETMQNDPNITAEAFPPIGWSVFILNMKSPILENQQIRQAMLAALDMEPILQAGFGEGFYRLDPGLMSQETVWYTTAGAELYNQADPDRARELLEASGYAGETIRWTCTQEYADHYNRSFVAVQQLEDVGFTIDLIVKDWATILAEQSDPEAWDVTATGTTLRASPEGLFLMNVCDVAGFWCDEETMDLVSQLRTESDFETRYELWEQIQQNVYEQVPFIKNGDTLALTARAANVHNLSPQLMFGPMLWNVWIED
jgi:peptide/nickel transport system substrate-binding protein